MSIENPSIYCDGHSLTVRPGQAARLQRLGLLELHPGVGEDGILPGDYILAAGVEWAQVYAIIERPRAQAGAANGAGGGD